MNPRNLRSVFLNGETGPSNSFTRRKVFDFDGVSNETDEIDGVAEVFIPWNLRGFRVCSIGDGIGAIELQFEISMDLFAWECCGKLEFGFEYGIRALGEGEEVPEGG